MVQAAQRPVPTLYKWGLDHPEYQPDFVAEGRDCIYMLEPKDASEMKDEQVMAKRDVGVNGARLPASMRPPLVKSLGSMR